MTHHLQRLRRLLAKDWCAVSYDEGGETYKDQVAMLQCISSAVCEISTDGGFRELLLHALGSPYGVKSKADMLTLVDRAIKKAQS